MYKGSVFGGELSTRIAELVKQSGLKCNQQAPVPSDADMSNRL